MEVRDSREHQITTDKQIAQMRNTNVRSFFASAVEAAALLMLGIGARFVPHLPNATPMSAIAMRARARFGYAGLAIPLLGMLLSDLVIGFYHWQVMAAVYASFALIGLMGAYAQAKTGALRALALGAFGSVIFFLITNAAVWATSVWYAKNIAGLIACYVAGLPFLGFMLLGDMLFALVLLNRLPVLLERFNGGQSALGQKLEHRPAAR